MKSSRATATVCGVLVLTIGACSLPRSGPTKSEIENTDPKAGATSHIVPVTRSVTQLTQQPGATGFSRSFLQAGLVGSDEIHAGDRLALNIWENVDQGLLTKGAIGQANLSDVQVDGDGYIFVPYAGRIMAAGNSPDELRQIITEKLADQTPDPQVTVARVAGDGATVTVMGKIGGQGVYPIERPTRTLTAMIAKAGGVAVDPGIALITVTRGKQVGKIYLRDVYQNPSLDIGVRGGDVILVEADPRTFTAMGATGSQSRVQFGTPTVTAIEALAQVGGLSTATADPTGIFVLRDENEKTARAVLGRSDLQGPQRITYVMNLTQPDGIFNARDFQIHDGDTVYVTEAPYVRWQKSLSVLTGATATANQLVSAVPGN